MERKYLVTVLALVATFAIFSRGLRSLDRYSHQTGQHVGMTVGPKCPASPSRVSQWMAKVRTHLHPANPEEAQLLAEMNLPVEAMQAKVEEQAARQGEAAARCARETARRETELAQREAERAQREAERAQRQAMRIQEKMAHVEVNVPMDPMSFKVNIPDGLQERIQVQTSVLANRISMTRAKLQVAAERWQEVSARMADSRAQNLDFRMEAPEAAVHKSTHIQCKVKVGHSPAGQAMRDNQGKGLRPGEYAF